MDVVDAGRAGGRRRALTAPRAERAAGLLSAPPPPPRQARENCGVVGLYSSAGFNVVPMAIDALRALQHRGQEAWGIAVPGKDPLKRTGLVSGSSASFRRIAAEYAAPAAIGHVRYSTMGSSSLANAQPLKVRDLCVAHNGDDRPTRPSCRGWSAGARSRRRNASDTLVAAQRLVELISEGGGMGRALSVLKGEMVGSYCFAFLAGDGSVYAARDPKGFRPMVVGSKADVGVDMVASESSALSAVGARLERSVRPGEAAADGAGRHAQRDVLGGRRQGPLLVRVHVLCAPLEQHGGRQRVRGAQGDRPVPCKKVPAARR